MKQPALYLRTLFSLVVFFILLAGLVFRLSRSTSYGWGFLLSFCLPTLWITLYFLQKDPGLIERRVTPSETRPRQIVGQSLAGLLFFAGLIGVPALDERFGWSHPPFFLSHIGNLMILFGFLIVFFVFRTNSYTAKSIEIMEGQTVISTGPYAVVRHPMYSGALLIVTAIPLSLGSWYGLISSACLWGLIVLRLLDEEKLLRAELAGYPAYCEKTRFRLVPYLW